MRPPQELVERLPLTPDAATLVSGTRARIADILQGTDPRLLVVVGPCSIHDPEAALEYAERLASVRADHADALELVMRVYFEKPRTVVGWKGLINDPQLDGSFDIDRGLELARMLLVEIAELGVPAGCEFLDAATGQYYADLVSWGAIGARTTESQVHREIASGLSCPVGFKNGTDGNVRVAVDAIAAAGHPHAFLSPTEQGRIALYRTRGNEDAHLILRGGREPNHDAASVSAAAALQRDAGLERRIMIDCSHANSGKDFHRQVEVAAGIADRVAAGDTDIGGVMLESHLVEGRQAMEVPLEYGQSITDACLGWDDTVGVLERLARAVREG